MNRRQNEQTLTRRAALKGGLAGAAGLALTHPGKVWAEPADRASFLNGKPPRARSVIQIWMWGGPCHLDTFDPKPDAGYDYCGPLKTAISTHADGIQIGELLPQLARQADKYSIIRSMTHGVNAHETASYTVQTGRRPDRLVYPSVGSVVSLFKGYDHGYEGVVPPYVVLTELQGRFSEAGFLGQRYKPFATGGDPSQPRFIVEGILAQGISDERQLQRRDLLGRLDTLGQVTPGNKNFERFDQAGKDAYAMIFGEARKLFDLSTEKEDLRDRYGRNKFGQSCLVARRLVEHGVPYITINYRGWDTHKQHFETMYRRLPEMDQGMATLLEDLSDRGLLDSTIVWWSGEFGRTPRVQWEAPWNGGRGHYGNCFSSVVAGGGFRGGHIVGASDRTGEAIVDRPVCPQDLIGSMYELLGIDPEAPLPNPRDLTVQVMPSTESLTLGGGRLQEIM